MTGLTTSTSDQAIPPPSGLARRSKWRAGRLARRRWPLLATAVLLVVGMCETTWWGPAIVGKHAWLLPYDLWGTMVGANRLLHLHLSGLYQQGTALIALPGAALVLVPIAALIDATGLGLTIPGPGNTQPAAWLAAGPYAIALSATALFAADAIAERLGVSGWKRIVLVAAEAVALWNVTVRWGHPEDAVAVALFLYGVLALMDGRSRRSAWLIGAAVAVQPLVLLALPVILAVVPRGRWIGFLGRSAVPSVVLLGAAAIANWSATFAAVVHQPNWPTVDHTTPWTALAPPLGNGAVAAGPGRLLAIAVAVASAALVWHRLRARLTGPTLDLTGWTELFWWIAFALALRCVFESVMVAFYLWPVLAVALIPATVTWPRLISTSVAASTLTFVSQAGWRGPWVWWGSMTAGLVVVLALAWPVRGGERRAGLARTAQSARANL